jgi:SAM-dependent methyltransferase
MNRFDEQSPTDVAAVVRDFYDRHPYPPPLEDLARYRLRWDDPQRRRAEYHLFWPAAPYREDLSILVAGCGTSQAVKYAVRWPRARVTGIDVSESSLRHARALKRKHGLENLDLRCLPLERAGDLAGPFDYIVSTGVLHHLANPEAALAALRDVLAPAGAMHLMVYAPYGRAGVYLLQDYCRRIGLQPSEADLDGLVASLRALAQDHPFSALLRHAPDLQHRAGLADALLHPHDRPYSVPQFFELLGHTDLRFGRWIRQAPYLPHCGALAASPHQPRLARLRAEEQYAAVELFRGTMVRHSAVVYRSGSDGPPMAEFSGDRWRHYVPIRVPDALSVKERLPPGAAAVLINPKHTYTDIYLPVGAQELALIEAIDGVRTIGEIAATIGNLGALARLFERLWWYDQVVFDASVRHPR